MVKDKRVAELPQISSAAVVALERIGCLSCSDLARADFERVAFVLDDYNEAARLVREARRHCGLGSGGKDSSDPAPPGPLAASVGQRLPRHLARAETKRESPALTSALGVLAIGLPDGLDRQALKRRLTAMLSLLEHGASEAELAAAAILDSVESGDIDESELAEAFGKSVAQLVGACLSLRAIPVLPTGKLPRSYLDQARSAPPSARRVCAAHLAAMQEVGPIVEGPYAGLHLQALRAAGPDPLVDSIALDEPGERQRSGRRAA